MCVEWVRVLTARSGQLEGPETDIIECLIVENHALIGILHQLVNRESGIVRLHDSVRDLRGREHGECQHHPVRVLLPDLRNQQCSHPRSRSSSQRMTNLKPCKTHTHTSTFNVYFGFSVMKIDFEYFVNFILIKSELNIKLFIYV